MHLLVDFFQQAENYILPFSSFRNCCIGDAAAFILLSNVQSLYTASVFQIFHRPVKIRHDLLRGVE